MKWQLNRYQQNTVAFCVKNPSTPTFDECVEKFPLLKYMYDEDKFGQEIWYALSDEHGTANGLGWFACKKIKELTEKSNKPIEVIDFYFDGRSAGWYILSFKTNYSDKWSEDTIAKYIRAWAETIALPVVEAEFNTIKNVLTLEIERQYNEKIEEAVECYFREE